MSGGTEQTSGFCWAALVARALHPVDVQIVEALQWIEEPLSAGDLAQLFDGKVPWASLGHHMRRLTKLGAIELDEAPTTRNITGIRYRLVQEPRSGGLGEIRAMCRSSSGSPQEQDLRVENDVLLEIVTLHPDHLTSEEMVVRMEDDPSDTGRVAILDSLQELKRSGLIRFSGDVVEPTYAALRATAIFQR